MCSFEDQDPFETMWKTSSIFSFKVGLLDSFNPSSVTAMNPSPSPLYAMIDTTCITRICSKITGWGDYEVERHWFIYSEKPGKDADEEQNRG